MRRAALLMLLAACGPVEPCPDGSMLDGPGGLQLVESEHQVGWGQADCWHCHVDANLHKRGCTDGVDLVAVQEQVATDGLASCSSCHGDNGVGDSADTGSGDGGSSDGGSSDGGSSDGGSSDSGTSEAGP